MNMDHVSLEFTVLKYIICLIIVYVYYYYYIPMTLMDSNHSTQEHSRIYFMSTMVSPYNTSIHLFNVVFVFRIIIHTTVI